MHSNAAPSPAFDGAPSLKGGPHAQTLSSTPPTHGSDPPYVLKSSPAPAIAIAIALAQPPSNLSSFPLPATAPPHSATPQRPSSAQPPSIPITTISASPSPSPPASPSLQPPSRSSIPTPLQTSPSPQFSHSIVISPPVYIPSPSSNVPKASIPFTTVRPPSDPSSPTTPNSSPGPPVQRSRGTIPIDPAIPPSKTSPRASHLKPSTGLSSSVSSPINTSARYVSVTAIFGIAVAGFIVVVVVGFIIWYIKKRKESYGHCHGPSLGSFSCKSGGMYASKKAPWSTSSGRYPIRSVTLPLPPSGSEGAYNGPNGSAGGCAFRISRSINASCGPRLGNWKSQFTFEELMIATNEFSRANLLGEGGSGCVYKGYMLDGQVVAVKKLKMEGLQGEHEFRAEVENIGRVHHRHLVSLVGYCIADGQRLLVNEYVPNGTLEHHLHEKGKFVMDWATRLKIAIGTARGLAYLHEDCHPRIIHRDLKSSNVLLDNNLEAQVSDFGLAKISPDTYTHVTTRVTGSFGYMAPEYASTGKPSEKSDVYSFGVLLLELVSGKRPVDTSQPLGNWSLVKWAQPLLNHALEDGNFEGLVDPKLENNFDGDEMFCMVKVAAACICYSTQIRPRMGQVVRELENDVGGFDLSNGVKPGESTQYDPAFIQTFHMMAFGNQEYKYWEEASDYGLSAYV